MEDQPSILISMMKITDVKDEGLLKAQGLRLTLVSEGMHKTTMRQCCLAMLLALGERLPCSGSGSECSGEHGSGKDYLVKVRGYR